MSHACCRDSRQERQREIRIRQLGPVHTHPPPPGRIDREEVPFSLNEAPKSGNGTSNSRVAPALLPLGHRTTLGLVLALPTQYVQVKAAQLASQSHTGGRYACQRSPYACSIRTRRLDHDGGRCVLDQPLLFSGFRFIERLDVAPTNVASKHLLECVGAFQQSRRHNRQGEMAAGT